MTDNPFDQFDAPQGGAPVITDDGSNWASAPSAAAQKPPANPFDQFDPAPDTGYFAPERKVWGMMQADPLGTAGKLASTAASGVYDAAKSAVTGNWFSPLAKQTGAETSANTASPGTAGQVANAAALMTPGDMMAPGLSGKAVKSAVETPSEAELLKAGGADLQAARNTGVDYSAPHAVNVANTVEQQLYSQGIGRADAPRTYAKLDDARNTGPIGPGETAVMPINDLMGIRRGFSQLTADKSASDMDRAASATALGHYQSFLENPPPEAVVAGPASTASDLVTTGNANYAAGKRSQLVTNKEESADLRTSSTNSGRNYDNTVRQKLRPLVDPDHPAHNLINSWTPEEQQGLTGVVRGTETPTQNTLRTIGNLGAGGHGVGASVLGIGSGLVGEHFLGPAGTMLGFIPPMAGSVARTMQNSNARSAVEGLGEKLRQRSPLYQDRVANAPYTVNPDTAGIAAGRATAAAAVSSPDPDQPAYAKGGEVKKPTHEFLVQRLMKLAEKAKKAEKKVTKPILSMNDDTVTAALAKAQAAI